MAAAIQDNPTWRWLAHGLTHPGKVRRNNEDALLLRDDIGMWAVADGMGGYSAGDVASKALVNALKKVKQPPDLNHYLEHIEETLFGVNTELRQLAVKSGGKTIGSTIVLLALYRRYGVMVWAGDSRLYRLRDKQLYQLTVDHSQVSDYVQEGVLTPDEAFTHPLRNRITRAVGGTERLYLDFDISEVHAGDRYLLCSDGLSAYVDDSRIQSILRHHELPAAACKGLLQATLESGAGDNVTVIVIDITLQEA